MEFIKHTTENKKNNKKVILRICCCETSKTCELEFYENDCLTGGAFVDSEEELRIVMRKVRSFLGSPIKMALSS